MLLSKKLVGKLEALLKKYNPLRYERVARLDMTHQQTPERLNAPPSGRWEPIKAGDRWGTNDGTCWFAAEPSIPANVKDRQLAVFAEFGCEAALFVNGVPCGVFTRDDTAKDHQYVLIPKSTDFSKPLSLMIEAWAGNSFPGTMPDSEPVVVDDDCRVFQGSYLCAERDDVFAFVMDLEVLLRLQESLDENDLRKWEILKGLQKVWDIVPMVPEEREEAVWRASIQPARDIMAELLAKENGPTVPSIGVTAHSHLDTAWLWPIPETRRKCYRTFGSMVTLMERYPEVTFIQSSPIHAEMVRQDQPELFERIKKLVKEGRWEPNGGAWVEPDCNLTSGESLVRQFLFGIQWTRKHFDYEPDMFWQPDVFGYSAALPQILQGFNIPYFCTTKMAWNDTTRFPFDTFKWRGMDGSEVLSHLTWLHFDPDPKEIRHKWTWAQHKDSETKRLAAYGWGDGGGGPTQESMEYTRRVENLEGCPKVYHTTVSDFMQSLEAERDDWPLYVGELYLELHRGTLTSIHDIKKNNRRMEYLLRDAEFLHTVCALDGCDYPKKDLDQLWIDTLTNQFHDILPGSSIASVNDMAKADYARLLEETEKLIGEALLSTGAGEGDGLLFVNTLGWDRQGTMEIKGPATTRSINKEGIISQRLKDFDGNERLIVDGLSIPSFSGTVVPTTDKSKETEAPSPFILNGRTLETPYAIVKFDEGGRIDSYRVKSSDREIVVPGGKLNRFFVGEDVPEMWDNWDIDDDQERKMVDVDKPESWEVVAEGPLQLRIRSVWKIGFHSTLTQDMIFHHDSPRITFETKVDWQEKHMLLKTGFDIDVPSETVRHEIQFGHVERPNHRNYLQDRAKFEVACQKWSDLSDEGFGVAILNDCKYGLSTYGTDIRLTMLKSGTHPDERADPGVHEFTYGLLPHEGRFSVENVVKPAFELNVAPWVIPAPLAMKPKRAPFTLESDSVFVDTVKWAEDGNGYVIRLYEAGRRRSKVTLAFDDRVRLVESTNLLEENGEKLSLNNGKTSFFMRPFEIKTLRCRVH